MTLNKITFCDSYKIRKKNLTDADATVSNFLDSWKYITYRKQNFYVCKNIINIKQIKTKQMTSNG